MLKLILTAALLLTVVGLVASCRSRPLTCFELCRQRRKPDQSILIVRLSDGRLHALIEDGEERLDPTTMKPETRPVELLCQLRPRDLR